MKERTGRSRRVAVVGAGMVGLSTAWFLQERDIDVVVLDRQGVAAGATWGNAGWLTPGLATPLPEPAVLAYGIRALLKPSSPVYVPPAADVRLLRFLARFARNSTAARWRKSMSALVPINGRALAAYDDLLAGGVDAITHEATPFLAAYRTGSERAALAEEISHIRGAGQSVDFELLDGEAARAIEPSLSEEIGAAIRIDGQRFIDPACFAESLGTAVQKRGAELRCGVEVTGVRNEGDDVLVAVASDGGWERFDGVVLATGAWLGGLARSVGVRTIVQAGRGYSFSCSATHLPSNPVYFPAQRVACTPLGGRLRVAGMMEFRQPGARFDPRRVEAIVGATAPLFRGVDLDARQDEWVGSRPVTPDGLPLIGRTRAQGVYVAGGHGMWGVTLGPATGQLLAEMISSGRSVPELVPFDPLR